MPPNTPVAINKIMKKVLLKKIYLILLFCSVFLLLPTSSFAYNDYKQTYGSIVIHTLDDLSDGSTLLLPNKTVTLTFYLEHSSFPGVIQDCSISSNRSYSLFGIVRHYSGTAVDYREQKESRYEALELCPRS